MLTRIPDEWHQHTETCVSIFAKLREELERYLEPADIELVYEAYRVAAAAHRGQKRHSGDPYISHPVAVAQILAEMRLDSQSIIAGLLHDVLEDCHVDQATLSKKFGQTIAVLVDGVTKLTQIEFESRAEAQAENFRKMLLAMAHDIRVILVKLADRLHNMRTLDACSPEKRRRIAQETLDIYAPIANRLGMHDFRIEFENLGFAALYPLRARILQANAQKVYRNRIQFVLQIEKRLQQKLEEQGLEHFQIWRREKHLYAIYLKMKNKRLPFSEIMDVYSFRIVVDSIDNCYRTLGLVHNLFKPLPERFKDYIAIPKANGYQSLHTTLFGPHGIPMEIQIRTNTMEEIANAGITGHWLYQSGDNAVNDAQLRTRAWVKGLLEIQKSAASSLEFIENVKFDLFPDEVYIFTPKGDIMELPANATPVDFAYAVHSDVGNTCVAAKIDRRLAPLTTRLLNGQRVEIITSATARPNPAWLNFVVTGKARSSIKHYLKTQMRTDAVILGRRLLTRALAVFHQTLETLPAELMQNLLTTYHYKHLDDCFEAIGLGHQNASLMAHQLMAPDADADPAIVSAPKQPLRPETPLVIQGSEGMSIVFADCCHPIPGDFIVGRVAKGKGMLVHRDDCPALSRVKAKTEQTNIPLSWATRVTGAFKAAMFVQVANQRGVLARLAALVAETEANIENITVTPQDQHYAAIDLIISVHDRNHLAQVMRKLRSIREIERVVRV